MQSDAEILRKLLEAANVFGGLHRVLDPNDRAEDLVEIHVHTRSGGHVMTIIEDAEVRATWQSIVGRP